MKTVLLTDFGSTYTKCTLVDLENREIIRTSMSFTTIDESILIGYRDAYRKLEYLDPIDLKLACSSAAGGLIVTAIGLVKELTVEAAKRAALGAGAKVEHVYANFLTNTEIEEIMSSDTDIVLLAGGTDGGNIECILHNAKLLAEHKVPFPIVVAGNKHAQERIKDLFDQAGLLYWIADNVMPELNKLSVESAKEAIREIFIERIIEAKGIKEAEQLVDAVIMPTPAAVLKGLELLSTGTKKSEGIGDLICLDIGGATTDIHSISKGYPSKAGVILQGLEEPFAKRTVEGDLGMRYSAKSLYALVGDRGFLKFGIPNPEKGILFRKSNPNFVPVTKEEQEFDLAMAAICADEAMSRHIGYVESMYSPMGTVFYQHGKDLMNVRTIIATGGVVIHNPEVANYILFKQEKANELRPTKANILIDKEYVFAALSLLGTMFPDIALEMMKKYLWGKNATQEQ